MASSNIKLFDENKGNMLSDSEFSISNQRMNGLQTGVASSQLQNKAMYQASLIAYAIAQIMMQNGLNANDTDAVSAFVANLSGTMLQKVYDIATTEEAKVGTATGKWMSPALVKAAIDTLAAKAQNILSDTTKVALGLSSTATPNDAFSKLAMPHGYYGFDVTVHFSDGLPAVNVLLDGLEDFSGNMAKTDENGRCLAVCANKTTTVKFSNYIGIVDTSVEITAQDGVVYTPVSITLERDTAMKLIQTSQTLHVLTGVPVDMCIVGGGASGRTANYDASTYGAATGGGGGYAVNILNKILTSSVVELVVGAGGVRSTKSNTGPIAGGNSSVTYDGVIVTANGATSGTGNGSSSGGADGTNGSVHVFEDSSLPIPGGGGGGGCFSEHGTKAGGLSFGGTGGGSYGSTRNDATNGTGPGGGGGGGVKGGAGNARAGSGAAGGLYIRAKAPEVSA